MTCGNCRGRSEDRDLGSPLKHQLDTATKSFDVAQPQMAGGRNEIIGDNFTKSVVNLRTFLWLTPSAINVKVVIFCSYQQHDTETSLSDLFYVALCLSKYSTFLLSKSLRLCSSLVVCKKNHAPYPLAENV